MKIASTIIKHSWFLAAALLLSCAGAPSPDWAASPVSLAAVYPDEAYIARVGRGQTREAAESAGASEIARYFSSQVSARVSLRETASRQNGVSGETLDFESEVFINSEITLFGLRYTPDAFYNKAEGQWQTVAYIDRGEAWAVYEPRFKKQADAFQALCQAAESENDPFKKALQWRLAARCGHSAEFEAANTLGQILSPARMNAVFSAARNQLAALPQKTGEAQRNAGVYIDCPVDFESVIVNAFSRAISAEGFPVSQTRSAAAVCTVTVDEGLERRELGFFYHPSLRAEFSSSSGVLFTFNAAADSISAVSADVAKRRAYKALEEQIQKTFSLESGS
jgi:plasmid stability protein